MYYPIEREVFESTRLPYIPKGSLQQAASNAIPSSLKLNPWYLLASQNFHTRITKGPKSMRMLIA